eukprot:GHVU01232566.1.p1 GENE.GHVU01232566.1~~GHVU01232566.1.p1  ORF type:complete len:175 (-),score=3.72 GHVU01232566.1:127-651(-)
MAVNTRALSWEQLKLLRIAKWQLDQGMAVPFLLATQVCRLRHECPMVVTLAPTGDKTWTIVWVDDDSPSILLLWSITLEGNSDSSSTNIISSINKRLQQLTDRSLAKINRDTLKTESTQIASASSHVVFGHFPNFDTFVEGAVEGDMIPEDFELTEHNQDEVSEVSPACPRRHW